VCRHAVYDDVGFSGATIDRPALQQLLDDIAAERVDTPVVTRSTLTRSITDFAKIVEIWMSGARPCFGDAAVQHHA
jgi:site-specific DNA recombinase